MVRRRPGARAWRGPTSATPAAALDGVATTTSSSAPRARSCCASLVVIAGEGPKANGIPEMFYPSEYLNRDPVLRHVGALITDGRYSGATYGPCIGHASPEALEGGGIGALRTGDIVYMDTAARADRRARSRAVAGRGRARSRPSPWTRAALARAPGAGGADRLAARAPARTSRPPSA